MPVILSCGACQGRMQIPDQFKGAAVQCPTCRQVVRVSAATAPPPAPAPAPAPTGHVLVCPGCKRQMRVPALTPGLQVRCPSCTQVVTVGAAPPPAPAPAPPPPAPVHNHAPAAPRLELPPNPKPATTPPPPPAPSNGERVTLQCHGCRKSLSVRASRAGTTIKCPGCGHANTVPAAAPKPPAPEPAELATLEEAPPPEEALAPAGADAEPDPGELSDRQRQRLEAELHRGERLIWAGKPDPDLAFRKGLQVMGILITSFVFLVGIGILMYVMMSQDGKDPGLFGAVGVGMACGLGVILLIVGIVYPFHLRWRYRRNYYVITDRRAIVFAANFFGLVRPETYMPADLQHVQRKDIGKDGAADLVFRTKTITYGTSGGYGAPSTGVGLRGQRVMVRKWEEGHKETVHVDYGFLKLRDANPVEQLLLKTLIAPWAAEFGKQQPQPSGQ